MIYKPTRFCEVETATGKVLVPFVIHRSRRAQHLRVRVTDQEHVELRIPTRVSEARALDFLRGQGDWIVETMSKRPVFLNLVQYLSSHPWVSAFGRKHQLVLGFTRGKPTWRVIPGRRRVLEIRYDPWEDQRDQLLSVLRQFAAKVIPERVEELALVRKLRYSKILVRDQRTRWGSCNERGTLSFNWRLILLPPGMQDYIILHELAHLKHLNHSPAFWKLLEAYDPQTTEHDQGVTLLSPQLMRLGR